MADSGSPSTSGNPNITDASSEEPSTSTAPSSSTLPEEVCAQCSKSPDSLKQCTKCHSVAYCNKDCQKAHFKAHKKVCASLAQEYSRTHEPKMASRAPGRTEVRDRGLQKWQFDT